MASEGTVEGSIEIHARFKQAKKFQIIHEIISSEWFNWFHCHNFHAWEKSYESEQVEANEDRRLMQVWRRFLVLQMPLTIINTIVND